MMVVTDPSEIVKVLGFRELSMDDPIERICDEIDEFQEWNSDTWYMQYPSSRVKSLVFHCVRNVDCVITAQRDLNDTLNSLATMVTCVLRTAPTKSLLATTEGKQRQYAHPLLAAGVDYDDGTPERYAVEESILLVIKDFNGDPLSIIFTPHDDKCVNMILMAAYAR